LDYLIIWIVGLFGLLDCWIVGVLYCYNRSTLTDLKDVFSDGCFFL